MNHIFIPVPSKPPPTALYLVCLAFCFMVGIAVPILLLGVPLFAWLLIRTGRKQQLAERRKQAAKDQSAAWREFRR
jgi:hypothetical protein